MNTSNFQRMILPVLIVLGAIVGGVFFNPLLVWAIVLFGVLGAMLFGRPGAMLFFYWLWASISPMITKYTTNPVIGYLDEVLMLSVVVMLLGSLILKRFQIYSIRGFFRLFIGLLIVLIVSFLANPKSIMNTFQAMFTYYLFPVVLLSTLVQIKSCRKSFIIFTRCFVGLFLFQFILNVGWFLRINPIRNPFMFSTVDFAQGTFGGAERVAYFSIAVLFFCFISALRTRGRARVLWLVCMVLTLINFYLTHTNHAYVMLVAIGGLSIFLVRENRALKLSLAACGIALITILPALEGQLSSAQYMDYQEDVSAQFSSDSLSRRWRRFQVSPKVRLLDRIVVQNARNAPMEWLIGMGPGMGVSVVGMSRGTPKAFEYLGEYYLSVSGQQEMSDGSIMSSAYSGIFSIWSEIGIIGFFFYIALYVYPWGRVLKQFKRDQYLDSAQLVLAESFLLVIPLFLMCNVLFDNFWGDFFVVGIWIWAGLVWNPVKEPPQNGQEIIDAGVATKSRGADLPPSIGQNLMRVLPG